MKLLQSMRDHAGLTALLALLLAVYLAQINHGLPNRDVVWGYDANPLIPLIAAKKIFLEGWNKGWHSPYPNFHYYVLLLFLTPYMAVQWLLGNLAGLRMDGGYPYGLKDFETIFMHLAIITRLVSVAMALGTAYWVYRIGETLHSRRAGLFAACIMGFSPAVVYYVHIETLDVPMLFWLSAAMYCYVRALQSFDLRYYIGLAILAAVSTATKDYAYGAFVLLPVPLVIALARHEHGSISAVTLARAAFDGRHVKAFLAFAAAFAIAENWVWNFSGFVNHVRVAGGIDAGGYVITTSFGRLDFLTPLRLTNGFLLMTLVLGWAGLLAGLGGLAYAAARERRIFSILIWPVASLYIFTVCQVISPDTFIERPYMPMAPVLAVFGGVLLTRIWEASGGLSRLMVAGAVAAVALNGIAVDAALIADPRYQAEKFLGSNVKPGARIEFYGKRSELPRAGGQWQSLVLNPDPKPLTDLELTASFVAPGSLAGRNPDWIVVSEAFMRTYDGASGAKQDLALHTFLAQLRGGELNYTQAARFVSPVPEALGLPDRYAPRVTVFARRP